MVTAHFPMFSVLFIPETRVSFFNHNFAYKKIFIPEYLFSNRVCAKKIFLSYSLSINQTKKV